MLEINPDITGVKPRVEVHFLGIGDARTCARLVFQAHKGKGVAATIVDMGNRFRMGGRFTGPGLDTGDDGARKFVRVPSGCTVVTGTIHCGCVCSGDLLEENYSESRRSRYYCGICYWNDPVMLQYF